MFKHTSFCLTFLVFLLNKKPANPAKPCAAGDCCNC